MTLFTLNVVFLPTSYNHKSSSKNVSSLAAEYPWLFCITIWSMRQKMMQFAETVRAHTSDGEGEMGSQQEYLGSYCINGNKYVLPYHQSYLS